MKSSSIGLRISFTRTRWVSLALLLMPLLWTLSSGKPLYDCGYKEVRKKSYGTVEFRVNCRGKQEYNIISALEYKGNFQHGIEMHYDSLWRKHDSSFFVNGKEEGQCLIWDTLGNIVARRAYRKGNYIGLYESYWAPGKPSIIKHYNAQGKEDGPWKQWWKNGNPKLEVIAENGSITSGTEYFPDGMPRLRFKSKPLAKSESLFKRKNISGEAWTPNGKSTGRIVNGNGEWTVFSAEVDSAKGQYDVFREEFKDSLMVHVHKLDSSEISWWLK
ncbi:MAG: hypothetical protein ABIW76_06560 [Fibrobacteria bacterium]